jgi:hypothetical protein
LSFFFDFFEIFWIFLKIFWIFAHILTHAHTHIYSHTCTHTHTHTYSHSHIHSHTHIHTLIYISLIRIERLIVSIRYNMCRGSSCKWNSEVKRARPGALWGWLIEWEVITFSVKWGDFRYDKMVKKSYKHSFSYYLGFYNF